MSSVDLECSDFSRSSKALGLLHQCCSMCKHKQHWERSQSGQLGQSDLGTELGVYLLFGGSDDSQINVLDLKVLQRQH